MYIYSNFTHIYCYISILTAQPELLLDTHKNGSVHKPKPKNYRYLSIACIFTLTQHQALVTDRLTLMARLL